MPQGDARERTSLAWRRTSLAFAVNGLLLLRTSEPWLHVCALLVLAAAAGVAAVSSVSFRNPRTLGWLAEHGRRAMVLVALVAAIGLLDLIAVAR